LNSDRSARLLKGPGRPFTPEADRAEILCSLSSVDLVVLFDERTAEQLVQMLHPDVYVKGGDYLHRSSDRPSAIPEAKVVEGYGGRVEILHHVAGHSTSRLVERVCQSAHNGEPHR
jgi:rfaE bifunctional protein nucleotidyltransferase chain/domain